MDVSKRVKLEATEPPAGSAANLTPQRLKEVGRN